MLIEIIMSPAFCKFVPLSLHGGMMIYMRRVNYAMWLVRICKILFLQISKTVFCGHNLCASNYYPCHSTKKQEHYFVMFIYWFNLVYSLFCCQEQNNVLAFSCCGKVL